MSAVVQEAYSYKRVIADGIVCPNPCVLGAFACEVTGTLTLYDGTDATGVVFLSAFPVTAGVVYPFCAAMLTGVYVDETTATGTFMFAAK